MRFFTLIVSAIFVVIGIVMIRDGDSTGRLMIGFFGFAILIAIFDPWLQKFRIQLDQYKLVITTDDVACEHRRRKRESIRWADVNRIWYITNADGPRLPDEWILLDGENGGCSFPTEANGMERMWDEFEKRFPGFDYAPVILGPIAVARHLCWERPRSSDGEP